MAKRRAKKDTFPTKTMLFLLLIIGVVLYTIATQGHGYGAGVGELAGIHATGQGGNLEMSGLTALVIFLAVGWFGWQIQRNQDWGLKLVGWIMIVVAVMVIAGHSPTEIGDALMQAGR